MEELAKDGVKPLHVEGLDRGRWVLMDFVDFMVHVMHPSARDFYQLELLWGDAPTRVFENGLERPD
jgi:ribosome-associated protein